MASSSSARPTLSPTTSLFHALWQVQPDPTRRRNAAADGFVEVSQADLQQQQCKANGRRVQPPIQMRSRTATTSAPVGISQLLQHQEQARSRRQGIAKTWSTTAVCECCGDEHSPSDIEECEVWSILCPPPKPRRPAPARQMTGNLPHEQPDDASVQELNTIQSASSSLHVQAGDTRPSLFSSLKRLSSSFSDIAHTFEAVTLFLIMLPIAWLHAAWTSLYNLQGVRFSTVYIVLPGPGRKEEVEYRIPFVTRYILDELVLQRRSSDTTELRAYSVPLEYEDEIMQACQHLRLIPVPVRPPSGLDDCIQILQNGKVVQDCSAWSERIIIVGREGDLVDQVALQANRRSRAPNRKAEYLQSRGDIIFNRVEESLAFLMPAKQLERQRDLSREELLGDEEVPLPQPYSWPVSPGTHAISTALQEVYLMDNKMEMGMEYNEGE